MFLTTAIELRAHRMSGAALLPQQAAVIHPQPRRAVDIGPAARQHGGDKQLRMDPL